MKYNRLCKYLLTAIIVINHSVFIFPQNREIIKKFIPALLSDSTKIDDIVLQSELKTANRLGINYRGIRHKYLISNNLDDRTKNNLRNNPEKYSTDIEGLAEKFSRLTLRIPNDGITREYYFSDGFLVSKPYYFSANWEKVESKYFIFHLSNPQEFTKYSINRLDNFVERVLQLLETTEAQKQKLKEEKIHYYLCKDEDEIEKLTGFRIKGMYFIPYDYIITTYNCHYHEICHLLINYRLKETDLYTLPLLQEGFAVCLGGRGGYEPEILLNMGHFLSVSGFTNYKELISKNDFISQDPSMSYPVSGIYNSFLLQTQGVNNYLNLYRKFSADEESINKLCIKESDLPEEAMWLDFLKSYNSNKIKVNDIPDGNLLKQIAENASFKISEDSEYYYFNTSKGVQITYHETEKDYQSKLFHELFPKQKYSGQKYIITVDSNEISVYNLYSNNIEAKYVRGFSLKNECVKMVAGEYIFALHKSFFDESLNSSFISALPE